MLQRKQQEVMPVTILHTLSVINKVAMPVPIPSNKKTHQKRVPQWYSVLMTMGWNNPITRKQKAPTSIPSKFSITLLSEIQSAIAC